MNTAQQQLQGAELGVVATLPEMDDRQFGQWTRLLEQRTGMVLPRERKSFLVTSLGLRMREIGCISYQEYFELLNAGRSGLVEWSTLVDRLTVHETRFFRHPASLGLIRDAVRSKAPATDGKAVSIQAWSVGCSTGEEAFTLAMVIDQCLRARNAEAYFGITATDISQPSLMVGRRAIYNNRRLKDVPRELLREYFVPVADGRYQVSEPLRKRVCFARMNILDIEREPLGKMDIIYCQNLLIYFDRDRRAQIVGAMVEHLSPGGVLILGSGELVHWSHPAVEKVSSEHTLAYRYCAEGGVGPGR